MSVFNTSASAAKDAAEAYVRAVLDLLGDRDPLEVLTEAPAVFAAVVEAESPAKLRTPEREGAWSIGGVIRHMADSELVWGYRLRTVLTRDRPSIGGYDQDRWADRLGYERADATAALGVFRSLRDDHLRLLDRLTDADLQRVGVHAERGDESLAHMIRLWAGHDLVHRNQIERIRTSRS